jgi:hypothetical protein
MSNDEQSMLFIRHSTLENSSFNDRQAFSLLTDEQGAAPVIVCGLAFPF